MSDQQAPEAETSVLVVEDDAIVRDWISHVLAASEFRIVGIASSASEAADLVDRRRPDVLLVDHRLPDQVGAELLRGLRLSGVTAPALLMTANPQEGFNEAARDAGAQGTALKSGHAEELLSALRSIARGDAAFDPRHPKRPAGKAALSRREREVLRLVANGATNKQVATALGVGDETVKTLLGRIFAKLGVRRRAEAVSEAHNQGLL
jgi:DNA-binding NarL/FixJ family response regulator